MEKYDVVFTSRALFDSETGVDFFFIPCPLSHPLVDPRSSGPQNRTTTGTLYFHPRRDRSICFAAGIAWLAATSFLSYLLCSPCVPPPRSVRWLTHVLCAPHGRFDRWTNRPVVISTYPQVRLIRPGDVFIHRAALPLWWMTRRRAPLPTLRAYLWPASRWNQPENQCTVIPSYLFWFCREGEANSRFGLQRNQFRFWVPIIIIRLRMSVQV